MFRIFEFSNCFLLINCLYFRVLVESSTDNSSSRRTAVHSGTASVLVVVASPMLRIQQFLPPTDSTAALSISFPQQMLQACPRRSQDFPPPRGSAPHRQRYRTARSLTFFFVQQQHLTRSHRPPPSLRCAFCSQ